MSDTPIVDRLNQYGKAHYMALETARQLEQMCAELQEALRDMNAGWKYIRDQHGDLYGVGWDRAQNKADAALTRWQAIRERFGLD